MVDLSVISDEALCQSAAQGNLAAEEQLVKKYNRLVKVCSRPYFLVGGDSEDLIQEGMMGLLTAIRQYDPGRDAAFKTYAELCIRNRLYTALKSATRYKHTPLNDYISFDSSQFDENQTRVSSFLRDPEELLIARERVDEIVSILHGSLSRFEAEILEFYLEGLSYAEIAVKVDKTQKSVDNAVQRIRKKLAQYL